MFIKIEQEEAVILKTMKPVDVKVYVLGMRFRVDWETWVIGQSAITNLTLREVINLAEAGDTKKMSKDAAKACIKRLEKSGLIKKLKKSNNQAMVIELTIAKKINQKIKKRTLQQTPQTTPHFTPHLTPHLDDNQVFDVNEFSSDKIDDNTPPSTLPSTTGSTLLNTPPIYTDINTDINTYINLPHSSACAENALVPETEKKVKTTKPKRTPQKREPVKPPQELIDFKYTDADIAYCAERDLEHPETEFENFREYYLIRPKYWIGREKIIDWPLAFKGWMRRQKVFANKRGFTSSNKIKVREPRTVSERFYAGLDKTLAKFDLDNQGATYEQ